MEENRVNVDRLEKELTYLRFEKQKFLVKSNTLSQNIKEVKIRSRIFLFLFLITLVLLLFEVLEKGFSLEKLMERWVDNTSKDQNIYLEEIIRLQKEIDSLKLISFKKEENVFRVQIGSFKSINQEISLSYKVEGFYFLDSGDRKSLVVGSFGDKEIALEFCKMLRRRGVYDAFVVYDDGVKVTKVHFEGTRHLSY